MNVTVNITDDQVSILQRAFTRSRYDDPKTIAEALFPLAINFWLEWIAGTKRYTSLTEQYTDWIDQIYTALLMKMKPPLQNVYTIRLTFHMAKRNI